MINLEQVVFVEGSADSRVGRYRTNKHFLAGRIATSLKKGS